MTHIFDCKGGGYIALALFVLLIFGPLILSGCGLFRPAGPESPPGIDQQTTSERPGETKNGAAIPGKGAQEIAPERVAIADLEGKLAAARAALVQKQAQERENEEATWRRWSRWIAGLGLPLAFAAGALGAWFGLGRVALPIAGAVVVFCGALLAFGEALPWVRFAAPVAGVLAIVGVAVLLIVRQRRALVAGAHLGDALETGKAEGVAKAVARAAQEAAGVWGLIQTARRKDKE